MNEQVRLIIYKKKSTYDDIIVSSDFVYKYRKDSINEKTKYPHSNISDNFLHQKLNFYPILLSKKGLNAYLVSIYTYTMHRSDVYRKSALELLLHFIKTHATGASITSSVIFLKLRSPKYQYLDYGWNERLTQMVMEAQEIDVTMSWLSTLGGAFSALGDQFDHCAKVAGKISVHQFKLAVRLGNPQLVARCKLYAALSLLQQGHFKLSKHMVQEIYKFAIDDKDIRLQRMCQGVWAKLKYCYSQRKITHRKYQNINSNKK